MITRLLVANRAEIASRIFRTCRDQGIETVAVCSEADASLPYVAEADYSVRLPGNAPSETYLDADAILAAAERSGADAIHPGYGFLSENADFAEAVLERGLVWVGPRPDSIRRMGDKIRAKELAVAAGVPVLTDLDPGRLTEAELPVLIKASAGGGGRGMRIVRDLEAVPDAVDQASAEAASAFGDGTVFIEHYVEQGRHIEVQVVGNGAGGVLVLGDRDCSIQRRHQKVVEEAPAPNLPEQTRAALHEAARSLSASIDYLGAGTVEFLYDAQADRFFFLEMNTRLQVEHPVTEEVFGVDLVELQLLAAETVRPDEDGAVSQLGWAGPAQPEGYAVEVRLYAEDPSADYQPQSGRLSTFEIPRFEGVRVETGFASGSEVSTHYDAMLAKVIASGATREIAARRLIRALRGARIHGVRTNRHQLLAILGHAAFRDGEASTALLSSPDAPTGDDELDPALALAAAAAVIADLADRRTVQRGIPSGWRNVVSTTQRVRLLPMAPRAAEQPITVEWLGGGDLPSFPAADFEVLGLSRTATGRRVEFVWEGTTSRAEVVLGDVGQPGHRDVHVDGPRGSAHLREVPRFVDPAAAVASGSLLAPMPGTVVAVTVEPGAEVSPGQPVLVLEAMKMQHTVEAPHAGVVTQINVEAGAQVAAGEVLAVVEGAEA